MLVTHAGTKIKLLYCSTDCMVSTELLYVHTYHNNFEGYNTTDLWWLFNCSLKADHSSQAAIIALVYTVQQPGNTGSGNDDITAVFSSFTERLYWQSTASVYHFYPSQKILFKKHNQGPSFPFYIEWRLKPHNIAKSLLLSTK